MSNREIIEWLKKKAEAVPMPGARKMYEAAAKALEAAQPEHGTNLAEVGTDCISRQQAIKTVGWYSCHSGDELLFADNALRQLPPVNCSEFPNNSDTISRQDAVSRRRLLSDLKELITAWEKYPVMAEQIKGVEVAIGYVELIPSAQPEIIRCKDCKHWIPYDWMFSEVWRSKNMADYPEDEIGCDCCDMAMKANDFCSRAERREETT